MRQEAFISCGFGLAALETLGTNCNIPRMVTRKMEKECFFNLEFRVMLEND
jgi:hypothetical protein